MGPYLVAGEDGEAWRACIDEFWVKKSEDEMGRLQGVEGIRRVSHVC